MKNITFYGMLVTLMMILSSSAVLASTFNFDFADIADNPSNPNYVAPGEYGAPSITFTDNASWVSTTASGFKVGDPSTKYNAYLDQGDAGLGVCKELNGGAQCVPSSDDNVTRNEVLSLDFNQAVNIKEIDFHNGSHGKNFNGDVDISIDGGSYVTYALQHIFSGISTLTGKTFLFANNNLRGGNYQQFYINSLHGEIAAPIPAAVWLFMSGLGSLGFFSRRKKLESMNAIAA